MHPPPPEPTPSDTDTPGWLILQIDGLSRRQLEKAMANHRMPYLKKLCNRPSHRLASHYSGLPSSTPAVQGEIFYGKRCAVPSFSFYDRVRKRPFRMYHADDAATIAEELQEEGEPLLRGGASYCNIYVGGAQKAKYCGETNTLDHWISQFSLIRLMKALFHRPFEMAQILWTCLLEFAVAIVDAFRGLISLGEFLPELKFIPSRVGICIAVREAVRLNVEEDLRKGLPIIYANFLGYDEQAHRRGPDSLFAHSTLRAIDRIIRRLHRIARNKGKRPYRTITLSDHGQESTLPYEEFAGKTLAEQADRIFASEGYYAHRGFSWREMTERSKRGIARWLDSEGHGNGHSGSRKWIRIHAMGPLAQVYAEDGLSPEQRRDWARRFCREGKVPFALYRDGRGEPRYVTADAEHPLARLRAELEDHGHPFAQWIVDDLAALLKNRYAGDIALCGYRFDQTSLSFAIERGAHAGFGPEETEAFAIFDRNIHLPATAIRPIDLRKAVQGGNPKRDPQSQPPNQAADHRRGARRPHAC